MKIQEIADFLSAQLVGDGDVEISRVASVDTAATGDIAFVAAADATVASGASCLIVPINFAVDPHTNLIRVRDPKLAFTLVAKKLRPREPAYGGSNGLPIAATADIRTENIGAFVSIGEKSYIGEGCDIGDGVRIGRNVVVRTFTVIHPNCVIYDGVEIGNGCVIHAGTVLGSDGFGYVRDEQGEHHQFPQAGTLVIEDNVEIGANCTIDRGSLGETRIGAGTKIDNMVHIAHNVSVGKRVLIAGQSGIAGSSTVGDDVVIAGQVGIADHVVIKAGAVIGAKSSVFPNKVIGEGIWSGIPVQPVDEYRRQHAMVRGLGRMRDDVRRLNAALKEKP